MGKVIVETGARLHLGFYRLCKGLSGLVLGGVGLAVDLEGIGTRVVFEESSESRVEVLAPAECRYEAIKAANHASRLYGVGGRLYVEKCIPRHVGLGSTTQLTLSTYTALARAAGFDILRVVRDAGRGFYSGVGVGVFMQGGLVLDTGVYPGQKTPRPMTWSNPPAKWGIVVVIPRVAPTMLVPEGGDEEKAITDVIQRLSLLPPETCVDSYRAVLDLLLPGAALGDFELFTKGVEMLEAATAAIFDKSQGGSFCCREAEIAAVGLRSLGARGVGQSSWGPTVYGFFSSRSAAVFAARVLQDRLGRGFRVVAGTIRPYGARMHRFPD